MLYSKLIGRTNKTAPADEVAKNAQLLIRAGFINKEKGLTRSKFSIK